LEKRAFEPQKNKKTRQDGKTEVFSGGCANFVVDNERKDGTNFNGGREPIKT
jgi:hypothetical protein